MLKSLFLGFALALFGIYALLAIPLQSYSQPVIIMGIIPFGMIGAVVGHIVMDIPINMLSLFGIIALSGVVVNDSLILVDFVNQSVAQGKDKLQAVLDSGTLRFRAIMLTSLTTFFGLFPMLLEDSLQAQMVVPMAVSLAFGIIISAMVYIFGTISGTHINPSVTIGLAIGKLMPKNEVIGYILAQIFGAILASGILLILFPNNQSLGATIPSGELFQSFSLEFILTFFLMLTILGITSKKENSHLAGLVIGLMVTGMILFGGPISGGSFNPARSLAPAIISGNFTALWIYLIAPTLGTILAMFVWKLFNKTE